jgi:hypothetical protein
MMYLFYFSRVYYVYLAMIKSKLWMVGFNIRCKHCVTALSTLQLE